jgi:hypothetical protein
MSLSPNIHIAFGFIIHKVNNNFSVGKKKKQPPRFRWLQYEDSFVCIEGAYSSSISGSTW